MSQTFHNPTLVCRESGENPSTDEIPSPTRPATARSKNFRTTSLTEGSTYERLTPSSTESEVDQDANLVVPSFEIQIDSNFGNA